MKLPVYHESSTVFLNCFFIAGLKRPVYLCAGVSILKNESVPPIQIWSAVVASTVVFCLDESKHREEMKNIVLAVPVLYFV